METKKQTPAAWGRQPGQGSTKAAYPTKSTRPPSKVHRVLAALCEQSYNRFDAEIWLHDHCLHSTVASIQGNYGIRVDRRPETVPGFQNMPTRCCRYWIAEDQRHKAQRVLRHARQAAGRRAE